MGIDSPPTPKYNLCKTGGKPQMKHFLGKNHFQFFICTLILGVALISGRALGSPSEVWIRGSELTHSDSNRNSNLSKPVAGHTYITSGQYVFRKTTFCNVVVPSIQKALVGPDFPESSLTSDYVIGCVPNGEGSEIFVQLVFEPKSEEFIPIAEDYLKTHQDLSWDESIFHFEKLKSFEIRKELYARHLPDPEDIGNFDYEGYMNQLWQASYPHFAGYLQAKEKEIQAFRSEKLAELHQYIQELYDPAVFLRFKDRTLLRSNIVLTTNHMRMVLENGKQIKSIWSDGAFRNCGLVDSGFCAKP